MSIKNSLRAAAVLATAACMLLIGMIVAQAQAGISGSTNTGPAGHSPGEPAAAQPAAATTTNTDPTPVFTPSPLSATYVPITPCRAIDTRPNIGRIPANATVGFHIRGTAGFPAQGGTSGGCGIPESATAVTVSVSSVNIAGTGYFRIWPYGIPDPGATIAHYQAGPISTTGGTITLGADPSAAFDVNAKAFQSGAGLVVDVTGYWEPQTHFIVLASGQVWYGNSTHMTKLIHSAGTGTYTMIFDRSLTGCNVIGVDNGDQTVRAAVGWGGTSLTVNTYQLVSGSYVHGDQAFQVFIAC